MSDRAKLLTDELSTLVLQLQLATHKINKSDPAYIKTKATADRLVDVVRSIRQEVQA